MGEPLRALVTGVNGQDGYYLSKLLHEKGYKVYGMVRHCTTKRDTPEWVEVVPGDITDPLLRLPEVDEVYNLAAMSFVEESFRTPLATMQINALGAMIVLEFARRTGAKFYQASTSELFGISPPPQNENTPFHPRSPYSVAKLAAYWATVNYREAYGVYAVNGILFNHESPRRGMEFVTQKVCTAAAKRQVVTLGNMDAIRDWGHAEDYVRAMWMMLQQPKADDYVVATGEGRTVRDLCRAAYGEDWQKFVVQDPKLMRPSEVPSLVGDASKIRALGWRPEWTFDEMIKEMVNGAL